MGQPGTQLASPGDARRIRDVRLEQAEREDWSATAGESWSSASELWAHLCAHSNLIAATDLIDWREFLTPGARVLDLGCGSGWLAAKISRIAEVERVLAWDSSLRLLRDVLPAMVAEVGGDTDKIERVCGTFTPLLLDDDSIDLVAMSSAFHHATQPEALLEELRRVLSASGVVVLLNETPWPPLGLLGFSLRLMLIHLWNLAGLPQRRWVGEMGDDHVLYDPRLGDRAYTARSWRSLARRAGFSIQMRDTGMFSYPDDWRRPGRFEPKLTHIVLSPL
jgi:ubiquinone/menaquinone biosynthesis C-methylase UbiE